MKLSPPGVRACTSASEATRDSPAHVCLCRSRWPALRPPRSGCFGGGGTSQADHSPHLPNRRRCCAPSPLYSPESRVAQLVTGRHLSTRFKTQEGIRASGSPSCLAHCSKASHQRRKGWSCNRMQEWRRPILIGQKRGMACFPETPGNGSGLL